MIRPNDPVATEKLANAEKLMAQALEKAKQDAEFNRLITLGDENVKQTKYAEAITNFKGALTIRPNDRLRQRSLPMQKSYLPRPLRRQSRMQNLTV